MSAYFDKLNDINLYARIVGNCENWLNGHLKTPDFEDELGLQISQINKIRYPAPYHLKAKLLIAAAKAALKNERERQGLVRFSATAKHVAYRHQLRVSRENYRKLMWELAQEIRAHQRAIARKQEREVVDG